MNRMILPAAFVIALCASPVMSFAQETKPAAVASTTTSAATVVTLSASDQKKVVQDLLVASLRIELDNKDARTLQDDINKAMKTALDTVKAEPAIKVNTGGYYVYNYDPNPTPPKPLTTEEMKKRQVWKGSQALELKSKDAPKLLEMLGKLQDTGFVMSGLNYTLSPELAESQKDELLVGALKKIQDKAALVAKAMGKSGYDIVELNIDNSYIPQPQPVMMMARGGMAKAEMAAPVAAPSEDDVTLNVSAKISLK